jgi:hypothetical protein
MFTRFTRPFRVGAAASLLALGILASAQAAGPLNKKAYLTFSGPVRLPRVLLPAGTYTFEIIDSSRSDLVRVRDRNYTKVYFTGFTDLVDKPAGWPGDKPVALGEVPAGSAPPVLVWYPLDDSLGRRFVYR